MAHVGGTEETDVFTSQCKSRKSCDGIRNYDARRVDFSASTLDIIAIFTHEKCGAVHINLARSNFILYKHCCPCGPVYIVTSLVRALAVRPDHIWYCIYTQLLIALYIHYYLPIVWPSPYFWWVFFSSKCIKMLHLHNILLLIIIVILFI